MCPVCCGTLGNMRSFKGHIKKLVHPDPSVTNPHCFLRKTCQRHINLVARCGQPGDSFPICSKEFSRLLWEHVQLLTSSDESPGVTGLFLLLFCSLLTQSLQVLMKKPDWAGLPFFMDNRVQLLGVKRVNPTYTQPCTLHLLHQP